MKKILLFVALLLTGGTTFAQSLTSGIDPQNLDASIRPGDDFYHHAAGGWLRNNPLDGVYGVLATKEGKFASTKIIIK